MGKIRDEIIPSDQSFDSYLEVISWRDINPDCLETNFLDGEEAKRAGIGIRTSHIERVMKIHF